MYTFWAHILRCGVVIKLQWKLLSRLKFIWCTLNQCIQWINNYYHIDTDKKSDPCLALDAVQHWMYTMNTCITVAALMTKPIERERERARSEEEVPEQSPWIMHTKNWLNYIVAVIMSYLPNFLFIHWICERFAGINYTIQSIWIIWNCCCCCFFHFHLVRSLIHKRAKTKPKLKSHI